MGYDKWAERWIKGVNDRDLDTALALYSPAIEMRSSFAKVYAGGGVIKGKEALRSYWGELFRRTPLLKLTLLEIYSGHGSFSIHHRDHLGRNCMETVVFNDAGEAIFETACRDRLR